MQLLRTASLFLLSFASCTTFLEAWNGGIRPRRRKSLGHILLSKSDELRRTKVQLDHQHHRDGRPFSATPTMFSLFRKVEPDSNQGTTARQWAPILNMVVLGLLSFMIAPNASFALSPYNPQSVMAPTILQQIQWSCRLVTAAALGAIIGQERSGHPAGVRTMALVSMGAAMFTLCSLHGFGSTADPSRMASNVASGVGFIGAGVITTSSSSKVHGLTTAAAIWLSAAVGVGCGSGLAFMSGMSSLLTITILRIGRRLTKAETKKKLRKEDNKEIPFSKSQESSWIRKLNSTDSGDSLFRRP